MKKTTTDYSYRRRVSEKKSAMGRFLLVVLILIFYSGITTKSVSACTVDFTYSPNSPVCSGTLLTFTATITGSPGPYTYSWDFAGQGTSTLANPGFALTSF